MPSIHDFEPLWGNWILEKQLGRGSYGEVYLARRVDAPEFRSAVKHIGIPADERDVDALISEGITSTGAGAASYFEKLKDELLSEIRFMYRLRGNANVVAYEDHAVIARADGVGYDIFIRMELLEPLSVDTANAFDGERVCKLGLDICSALEALERERIIHRDIKPSNILVGSDGVFKLSDFGVARQMERTSMVLSKKGTYVYMAPEVYRGEEAGRTADLYSLGLVMHRLLNANRAPFLPQTGELTYKDTELALAKRLAGRELPPPVNASAALSGVIRRACAFLPKERYSCAADMKAALLRCLDTASKAPLESVQEDSNDAGAAETDASEATGSSRLERINRMRAGETELAATLRDNYKKSERNKTKRFIRLIALLCAAILLAVAAIIILFVLD